MKNAAQVDCRYLALVIGRQLGFDFVIDIVLGEHRRLSSAKLIPKCAVHVGPITPKLTNTKPLGWRRMTASIPFEL
jgi:hypothetical protein